MWRTHASLPIFSHTSLHRPTMLNLHTALLELGGKTSDPLRLADPSLKPPAASFSGLG